MKINMVLGVDSKSQFVAEPSLCGKLRSIVQKFSKKEPCICKSALEKPVDSEGSEPPEEEPVLIEEELVTGAQQSRINHVSKQVMHVLMMVLGVIGGIYAILKLCGCRFVSDDFEIIIRQK
jgi:hypothetical protein